MVQKDQVIYRQAEMALEKAYLCLMGTVEIRGYSGDKFQRLGSVRDGESFGEEAIYETTNHARKDTAVAVSDVYIMEFTKDAMI